ncbi:NADP-dependent aldehyde dehydrogenase [Bryocella elongata]|uniref:NADP-dependent aldehyde dehydrogenase n=1 Tax=Bryocella elongata TaxID=863522 RepID=A0A1H5Z1V3_9BACT|nr:aldehyde dehydrogenase (NADP(+)) [Bryocella elongata]SEG30579.1 NADP-dependent aldehyde dehydrogenase [Bryocella elongata]
MELLGRSFVAGVRISRGATVFFGKAAATGERLDPGFTSSSMEDVDDAAKAAAAAATVFAKTSPKVRVELLRAIAAHLEKLAPDLVPRAMAESGLPQARLEGELARTCGQLRLFASVVEDGSWQNARIDRALPGRKPLPRPDLRSVLMPLGPVAVFGASNFPLAFSVAGGDTASALAAGNPVVVKAHPAHPGTSEIAALAIAQAVSESALPAGIFSMLFDDGIAVGQQLVQHPAIEAVAFTGSHRAGRALMDLCASRPRPIPCFTEMSSLNPVFILPGALASDPLGRAKGLHGSFTLGAGQFCTKPGLVFLPESGGAAAFREELRTLTSASAPFTMLTSGIADAYHRGLEDRGKLDLQTAAAAPATSPQSHAVLLESTLEGFQRDSVLHEELFGPTTLLVSWDSRERMLQAAEAMEGHLTATLLGDEADLLANADLISILERKVGRLLVNGFPTGVEVSHAMVHGGPYPATSDSRFTSVGSQAILRFVRPVCYQNFPQAALPDSLRDENPLGIMRLVDGELTREAL